MSRLYCSFKHNTFTFRNPKVDLYIYQEGDTFFETGGKIWKYLTSFTFYVLLHQTNVLEEVKKIPYT